MRAALLGGDASGKLDLGCVASQVEFDYDDATAMYEIHESGKPATAFLFELIVRLQATATVPVINIHAYGAWLNV